MKILPLIFLATPSLHAEALRIPFKMNCPLHGKESILLPAPIQENEGEVIKAISTPLETATANQ